MTDPGDSHLFLIILVYGWYTPLKEISMHIVRLLERRFPSHKRSISVILIVVSLSLLLLGIGLMFVQL